MGTRFASTALVLAATLAATPARAVDGVIEINQASALAGGITPGDGAGFPVTLSLSASYRLTGNLELPSLATTGIEVTAPHASIDLNGFALIGTNSCGSLVFSSTGNGIDSFAGADTSVRNGSVSGMGYRAIAGAVLVENVRVSCCWRGIFVSGGRAGRIVGNTITETAEPGIGNATFNDLTVVDDNVLERSHIAVGKSVVTRNIVNVTVAAPAIRASGVIANNIVTGPMTGISTESASSIIGNSVIAPGGIGIGGASGSTIKDNTVTNAGGNGISCSQGCTVIGNAVRGGAGLGMFGGNFVGYANNVFTSNAGGSVSAPPIEIGTNICDTDTTCP